MSQTVIIPPGCLDPRVESLPPAPAVAGDFRNRLDGVVVPVWAGDLYLAKACCASIREHLGDIPITLLVDGPEADTRELQRLHGVQRLVVQEVATPEFLELCSGCSWTKLLLFWLSPYERFLCIDSDTILWGDVRVYAEFDKYDYIAAFNLNPYVLRDDAELQSIAFDVEAMHRRHPDMRLLGREFANGGVFFARRGVYSQELLMDLRRQGGWRCYEQGLFNYLRWRAEDTGLARVGGHRFQVFPAEGSYTAEDRFLPRKLNRPTIIHWIGKKPKLGRPFRTANDYRRRFLAATGRTFAPGTRLWMEDLNLMLQRHRRSLVRRLRGEAKKQHLLL